MGNQHQEAFSLAKYMAKKSKSVITQVGCTIYKNGVMVSLGVNHSLVPGKLMEREIKLPGSYISEPWNAHAEEVAIMSAARNGLCLYGSDLYVTTAPCFTCARLIHQAKIANVYYLDQWWDKAALEFLEATGVRCHRMKQRKDTKEYEQRQDSALHKDEDTGGQR